MRLLALGALCTILGSAVAKPRDRPMRPFDPGLGPVSISSDETTKSVRRVYVGTITAIADDLKDSASHIVTIRGTLERYAGDDPRGEHPLPVDASTPGRDRITVRLPSKLALPFAVGDTIHATMWRTQVGEMAWDYFSSITGPAGEPLIVTSGGAPGWTFEPGAPVPHGDAGAVVEHYVVVHGPDSLVGQVASSWAHGTVNGADFAVYGVAQSLDHRDRHPPHDWADVFSVVLVKVK